MTIPTQQDSLSSTLIKTTEDFDNLTLAIKQKETICSLLPTSILEKQTLCADLVEIISEETLEYNSLISNIDIKKAKKNLLTEHESTDSPFSIQTLISNLNNEIITNEIKSDILQQSISVQTAEHNALLETINIEKTEFQNLEPEIIFLRENLELLSKDLSSNSKTAITAVAETYNTDYASITPHLREQTDNQDLTVTLPGENTFTPHLADPESPPKPVKSNPDANEELKVQLVLHKKPGVKQAIIDVQLLEIHRQNALIKSTKSLRTHVKVSLKLEFHSSDTADTENAEIVGKVSKRKGDNTYFIKFRKQQNKAAVSLLNNQLEKIVSSIGSNKPATLNDDSQQVSQNEPYLKNKHSESVPISKEIETPSKASVNFSTHEEELAELEASVMSTFSDRIEDDFKLHLDNLENGTQVNKRKTTRYIRKDIKAQLTIYKLLGKSKPVNVELLDISTKGALINPTNTKLRINTKVTIELIFESDNRSFTILGTVVRKTIDLNFGIKFSAFQDDLGDHLLLTQTDLVFK